MVGQGCPSCLQMLADRSTAIYRTKSLGRQIVCALLFCISACLLSTRSAADEKTVRVRLAWGNNSTAKQRWSGQFSVDGGSFFDLQPLGIETDASVALRLEKNRLIVDPFRKRGFDGCDITVRADQQANIRFELRSDQMPEPTIVEVPLHQLAEQQLRRPLDDLGSILIAHRSPGDTLRVVFPRDNLVFQPKEVWQLKLLPDLRKHLTNGPVRLDLQLRGTNDATVVWKSSQKLSAETEISEGIDFEITCPYEEGAYQLSITARPQEGFATRFVPGEQARPLASREVEIVVIDSNAKLLDLVDQWQSVLTVDPANPSWWQRLPSWAQVPRFPGSSPGVVGNIRPVVRPGKDSDLVELPPSPDESEPYWQSYTLPVQKVGEPHLVEVDYPLSLEQHLAISVIEPDAAGNVASTDRNFGFYTERSQTAEDGAHGTHRIVFWPRTRSPQLLIANQHPSSPAQFGTIRLLRHDDETAATGRLSVTAKSEHMVAGYFAKPQFSGNFGAAEVLDAGSGLSIHGWSTFLDGASRMAQYLRMSGRNTLVLTVAADGSGLYPSDVLLPSPRYDTGLLATSGRDPVRKDVLEMVLRIFDREGLRVVPTIELGDPLPRLERLRLEGESQRTGIAYVGRQGKTWLNASLPIDGHAPYYNLLNDRVRQEIRLLVSELSQRYSQHSSFAGVGIQLAGDGYGMLPDMQWGLDDNTIAAFSSATGTELASSGTERFQHRAERLLGTERQRWQDWRIQQLSRFYGNIAQDLARQRSDLKLILTTENLFAGQDLQNRVRAGISDSFKLNQPLLERGLDLNQLNGLPGVVALAPYRLQASDRLQDRAVALRINAATDQGELISTKSKVGLQFYHATSRLRLPSFDERSPTGTKRTRLTLASQPSPAGEARRRHLANALARGDAAIIVEGGEFLPTSAHAQVGPLLDIVQHLPGPETAVHTEAVQPLVMRVYRSNVDTTIALINESPWPVNTQLVLNSNQECEWKSLGKERGGATPSSTGLSGTLSGGSQNWKIELLPYDLLAWKFESPELGIGQLQVSPNAVASKDLSKRIQEIESRTGNLNIERPYFQLQNPSFELHEEGVRIAGWKPSEGAHIELANHDAQSGSHSLRLRSHDKVGAAIRSNLFPTPETGQLTMSIYVCGTSISPETRLYLVLEDSESGQLYQRHTVLGGERAISDQWAKYELSVDDIPVGNNGQMCARLHLTGNSEVLVDSVELYDLKFDKPRRGALVKSVYAAKTALDEGQVMDCLRLVDEYWSQYLVEYVPPVETQTLHEAKQTSVSEATEKVIEEQGIRSRLRGWVPRIWR